MQKLIKYGIYVAAGVGIFEVLRRTGTLEKAGDWLGEHVPDDVKARARKMGKQVREGVYDIHDHMHDAVATAIEKAQHLAGKAGEAAENGAATVKETAANLSNGIVQATEDSDGASILHKVGRGIVH